MIAELKLSWGEIRALIYYVEEELDEVGRTEFERSLQDPRVAKKLEEYKRDIAPRVRQHDVTAQHHWIIANGVGEVDFTEEIINKMYRYVRGTMNEQDRMSFEEEMAYDPVLGAHVSDDIRLDELFGNRDRQKPGGRER